MTIEMFTNDWCRGILDLCEIYICNEYEKWSIRLTAINSWENYSGKCDLNGGHSYILKSSKQNLISSNFKVLKVWCFVLFWFFLSNDFESNRLLICGWQRVIHEVIHESTLAALTAENCFRQHSYQQGTQHGPQTQQRGASFWWGREDYSC